MSMDPSVAAALATLSSAIATAILMYSAYHWPSGHNQHEDDAETKKRSRKSPHKKQEEEEGGDHE